MIVVADASPLIFLGKIRRLDLIRELLGDDIHLPRAVFREVVVPGMDPIEQDALETFLSTCTVSTVRRPRRFASAMSTADNAALTLALRRKADILLCDERVTRAMAEAEGIRPLGTLGVLLRAMHKGMLSTKESRHLIDLLIQMHSFRISVEVYQRVLERIAAEER